MGSILAESIARSVASQKVISSEDVFAVPDHNVNKRKASVIVSERRTLEAAYEYAYERVAVLNSTWLVPGGGVLTGENGQQESLCRCTTLKPCLDACKDGFYKIQDRVESPLYNDDLIYTTGVTVYKSDDLKPRLMKVNDWFEIDVISCIPPDATQLMMTSFYKKPQDLINDYGKDLALVHERRLRRLLEAALEHDCDSVILPGFGCGRANNPAGLVAEGAANAVRDYLHSFKTIEFALYGMPADDVLCFKKQIRKLRKTPKS